ncbi:MAG: polyribonucleotide nucleotidyltransferase [Holosporaceae bacterium]|jgi:polyribonucleotide nucleotidyltransferase|nr:polyribonucleotide nucleotidyltransferase [Holosporaceae bacterium]
MIVKKEIVWGNRLLSIETGRFANQATGAVTVRYGDTIVLCTVVADKKASPDVDFFPLTVNYIEKAYSAGKIPGGFIKREGRPSERETLISRLIDRPIRPLFHENFKNETQVICTVLSFDGENDTDVISIIGTSAALAISGIPFLCPIAAARIGYENGEFILNPKVGSESDLDLVMAGSEDGVLMVESAAKELSEQDMLAALKFGHNSFQPILDIIKELAKECGKTPWEIPVPKEESKKVASEISKHFLKDIEKALQGKCKQDRNRALGEVKEKVMAHFAENKDFSEKFLEEMFTEVCSRFMREKILNSGRRIDNRSTTDIRDISIDVSVLPKVHGSAVFQRGETQAIVIATLGTAQDEQMVDSIVGEYKERFLLHYNFPPFSVGEIGRMGSPGRREIGHGKLAWRAISAVLPSKDEFPYSLRVVSEVLSCNGSSSMATVCGSSLALMDAGVPLKSAVAGIAMGLIIEDGKYEILSDILGEEDHLGDMDFKVAGTEDGITALQMDIKVTSVTFEIMEKAIKQAQTGRMHILKEMSKGLKTHRSELNENAPKMTSIVIPKDKIREVIGSGGKVIRDIIERTGAKIDIDDDGNVTVAAQNTASMNEALNIIREIAVDPVDGTIYKGRVVKIVDFGAFVNFYGSKEGLVHISEMSNKRVEKVTDIMNENDEIEVKFLGYDNKGRARLTMKFSPD